MIDNTYANENTPILYRHTPSRWPMVHPDTGRIVSIPTNKHISRSKSRYEYENPRWKEPIELQCAYQEMLTRQEWNWNWFCHLTFKEETHPEAADKVFNKWIHIINRKVFGVRYWNRKETDGVLWCKGIEYQQRGVIHFHVLIARVPGEMRRLWAMDEWSKMAGYARIHPYVKHGGAEGYICKYASKGGILDFGGPVNADTGQEALIL